MIWIPRGITPSGDQFLEQEFPGTELLLSLTKENSSYSGACFQVRRVSDSVTHEIGFSGKEADAAALTTAISGTTGRVTIWYDQSGNGLNAVQATTTRQWQATVSGGKVVFTATSIAQGMEVPANAAIQPTQPHLFFIHNPGFVIGDQIISYIGYTATGTFETVARWGLEFEHVPGSHGPQMDFIRNAVTNDAPILGQVSYGGLDGSSLMIWDYTPHQQQLRGYGGHVLFNGGDNTNVTYTGSPTLVVGNNRAYTQGVSGHKIAAVILYSDASVSDRDAINDYLISAEAFGLDEIEWTYTDADGFVWTGNFDPSFSPDPTDEQNMNWSNEHGGYAWSRAKATTNNSVAFYRMEVRVGDIDMIVTNANRSEAGGGDNTLGDINVGDTCETFHQFYIEDGVVQDGDWCLGFQHHYNDGATPDLFYLDFFGEIFQMFTQRNGTGTARGSSVPLVRDVWWNCRAKYTWSVSGNADTLEVWLGQQGTTLTKIVDVSGQLYSTDQTSAYCKMGVYGGNINAPFAIKTSRYQFSKTANAYSSFVTTQPALPTHA